MLKPLFCLSLSFFFHKMEREKLESEKAARIQLEREKKELEERLIALEKENQLAHQAKVREE